MTPESFERLNSIAPITMPGADKCAREGWRMAAKIFAEDGKAEALEKLAQEVSKPSLHLITAQANAPETTSLGRLFDAAASMFGICHVSSYEGEAPVRPASGLRRTSGTNRTDLVEVIDGHRILSRFFWHFPNTQIYSKQQRISKKHWLRYWQKRSSAPLKEKTFRKFASQAAAV